MTTTAQDNTVAETGLDLDRSDWELVTFGDVAKKQNTSVDRENTDLTRYVAGEHMGSEDLHLRQWGEIGEDYLGPAFTRKFEKGDILYGSRRTYLRKVAVAHFDGITANTTFVIKANKKLILPELLPFIMLSEGFAQHSIRNSKGSVNPYVNWKDIANYEFLLPPKDQQAKLAELLWAADAAIQANADAERKFIPLLKGSLSELVLGLGSATSRKSVKLEQLINVKHGFPFKSEFWAEDDGNLPITVTIGNYDYSGGFRFQSTTIKCYSGTYPEEYDLAPGDLLLAMTCQTPDGSILGIPGMVPDDGRLYLHNQRIGKVEIQSDEVDPRFLYLIFLTDDFRRHVIASASGTKVLHTSPGKIMSYRFELPSRPEQSAAVTKLDQFFATQKAQNHQVHQSKSLLKSLINQIF